MRPNMDGLNTDYDAPETKPGEVEVSTWPFAGAGEDAFRFLEGGYDEVTGEYIPEQVYDPNDPDSPPVMAGCNDDDGKEHQHSADGRLIWAQSAQQPSVNAQGRSSTR